MRLIFSLLVGVLVFIFSGCSSKKPSALVCEKNQISQHELFDREESSTFLKIESSGSIRKIDSSKNEVFCLQRKKIVVLDMEGQVLREIKLPEQILYALNLVVLPDGGYAILDNRNDNIYFIDFTGGYQRTVSMVEKPNEHLQSMNGIVVGNRLVISEDGFRRILQIDLEDYNLSVLRDFSRGRIGAIAHSNNVYYVAQINRIFSFLAYDDEPKLITELPESNITGIDIFDNTAFIVVNGLSNEGTNKRIGSVYNLNLTTGEYEKMIGQLQYPTDIELLHR